MTNENTVKIKTCRLSAVIYLKDKTTITVEIERVPVEGGFTHINFYGPSIVLGNRQLSFDPDGNYAGSGTYTGRCKPATYIDCEEEEIE